jgi:hypothetical protein
MTKEGYTHVLIPKSLHSILKEKSEEQKISINGYIQNLIENAAKRLIRNQQIEGSNPSDGLLYKIYIIKIVIKTASDFRVC